METVKMELVGELIRFFSKMESVCELIRKEQKPYQLRERWRLASKLTNKS
jgi:hypothetical protein